MYGVESALALLMFVATPTMPTKIFVGNIAVDTSRESMLQLFQRYGCVTECDVLGNYGFVVSRIICSSYFFDS